jgi:1-phosphatidylinositol phosphodiesterase
VHHYTGIEYELHYRPLKIWNGAQLSNSRIFWTSPRLPNMLPRMIWAKTRVETTTRRGQNHEVLAEEGYGTFLRPREKRLLLPSPFMEQETLDLTTWMSQLPDDTRVPGLTIPGTHDSAAYTISWPFVATQKLNIQEQLNSGIRYFDFRCGLRDDIVELVHGPTFLGLTLPKVLDTIYTWLEKHPSEALIVQIKEDRNPQRSRLNIAQAMDKIISQHRKQWRIDDTTCNLGELRGRIQLFRRYIRSNYFSYGLDVTPWVDNPVQPFTIYSPKGVQITIQDHYKFPSGTTLPSLVKRKCNNIFQLLASASRNNDQDHWYLNFTSAYELNFRYQIPPHQIAVGSYWGIRWIDGVNVLLRAHLHQFGPAKHRLGILAMDFPEQGSYDLVAALVSTNFEQKEELQTNLVQVCLISLVLLFSLAVALWVATTLAFGQASE